jgi:energy-coupling factor transporter ATP-binding protein EcfA2
MRVLAACGLADGRLWSMHSDQLSAGEQQRLSLACALAEKGSGSGGSMPVPDPFSLLIADEFDAHLDFDTARAIAQNLRRLAARRNLRVVVSTHRPEVLPWLAPARVLHLDGALQDRPPPAARDLVGEITFEQGRLRDWDAFSHWHYLGHGRPGPTAAVWLAKLDGRAVGIAVFGFPHLLLSARKGVLPRVCEPREVLQHGAAYLNANVRLLSRIVIDPRLRGCGVANALLRHALSRVGVPFIECIAQMGEFTGFLQRAGFEHAGKVQPPRAVLRVRRLLEKHAVSVRELMTAPEAHPHMQSALKALVNSRIESGHGQGRESHANHEVVLQSALARLYAEPAYFVWQGQ